MNNESAKFLSLAAGRKSIMNRKYLVIYLVNKAQPHKSFQVPACLPVYIGNGGFYQGRMSLLHTVRKFHAGNTIRDVFRRTKSNSKKKSGTSRVFVREKVSGKAKDLNNMHFILIHRPRQQVK
ncbi:hypothetical protein CEXT_263301 [Caerostris extrusa]|uniref:GIY-YIG homing endonuclease n=1 Tax=Caerostris extrusa TaxID=172846 RepID=A0AAV4W8A0_CAEEX|nr:hypothetical protein CEXT_263301 [Caerostris extrusa]